MREFVSHVGWFIVVAIVVAYLFHLIGGGIVTAQASGAYDPTLIRDEVKPNEHHLSGMIMVPDSCDELSVDTEALSSVDYALVFKTWHEPSVPCAHEPTPRAFHAVVFAPAAGVNFTATLDGASLSIATVAVPPGKND
jgi:hypothetical protein